MPWEKMDLLTHSVSQRDYGRGQRDYKLNSSAPIILNTLKEYHHKLTFLNYTSRSKGKQNEVQTIW